jgi:predicted HTH transcriptional regulator
MGWLTDLIKEYPAIFVAKESLALVEDRFIKIEEENKELKRRIAMLEAENKALYARVPVPQQPHEPEEIEIKIMTFLSKTEQGTIRDVAKILQISETKADYHLSQMEEAELLHGSYSYIDETTFSLAQKGRAFLVKKGLV